MYDICDLETAFQNQNSNQIDKILKHLTLNKPTANRFLLKAASLGYQKATKTLLEMGADIALDRYAIFAKAEENNHLNLFEFLVSSRLEKNGLPREIQLELINRIASHNRFKLSHLLDKLLGDEEKWTRIELEPLLCYACYMGRFKLVQKLYNRQVDINALQGKPLLEAIRGNNPKTIRFLLSKTVNPHLNRTNLMKEAAKVGLNVKLIKQIVNITGGITTDDSCVLTPFILKGKSGRKSLFKLIEMGAHILDNPNFYKILESKDDRLIDKLLRNELVAELPGYLQKKYQSQHFKGLKNGIKWAILNQEYNTLLILLDFVSKVIKTEYNVSKYPDLFDYLTGKMTKKNMCEHMNFSQESALQDLIRCPSNNRGYAISINILYDEFADYHAKVAAIESCVYYFNKVAFMALKSSGAQFVIALQNLVVEEQVSELNRLFELMYGNTLLNIKDIGDMAKILTYSDMVEEVVAQKALKFANDYNYSEIALVLLSIFDYSEDLLNDAAFAFKDNDEIRNIVIDKLLSAKTSNTVQPVLFSRPSSSFLNSSEPLEKKEHQANSGSIYKNDSEKSKKTVSFL